ncbi:MAG: hypothetical protein PUB21_03385 [Bacteroidales bacterium]|nr:hypothetical protein [Bacteroidales bacterium]
MSIFFFYNNRKPRKYEHKPIYWDPRKEALDERIAKIKKEMGIEEEDKESYKPSIKGSFVNASPHLKRKLDKGEDREKRKSRNIIIAVILVILLVVAYYMYF